MALVCIDIHVHPIIDVTVLFNFLAIHPRSQVVLYSGVTAMYVKLLCK
jgi:hypothetical protein